VLARTILFMFATLQLVLDMFLSIRIHSIQFEIVIAFTAKEFGRMQRAMLAMDLSVECGSAEGVMVCRRRAAEGVAWEQCVIVGCRKETTGQRLTVATGFNSAVERYTADVFLRKGKAGILWRFVSPVQRRTGDWDAALSRAAAAAATVGGTASVGTVAAPAVPANGSALGLNGLGGSMTGSIAASITTLQKPTSAHVPAKKRKADVVTLVEVSSDSFLSSAT
jgi:hypothetical protein